MSKVAPKLGCEFCPLDKAKNTNKVFSEIVGKDIMVWAMCPGATENAQGKELVGKAGKFWWNELSRVGIKREDCDISNVVHCYPTDVDELDYPKMRDPSEEEIKCCSIFLKQAIDKQKAKVWLVLGRVAREELFKKKPTANVFYQDDIRVFLLDHPSYFLRGGSKERLAQFRELLDLVRVTLDGKERARFAMYEDIRSCQIIKTAAKAKTAAMEILEYGRTGNRVAYDEEDDDVEGEHKLLCVGVCTEPGKVYNFVLDHPENKVSSKDKESVRRIVCGLLTNPHPKVLQHGNYDDGVFEKLLGVKLANYTFDTQYGEYCLEPHKKRYNLTDMVARNFPKYTGYKDLVLAAVPEGMSVEDGRSIGNFHLAKAPLQKVALYCCMDAHVTKLLEEREKDLVPVPLVRIYTEAAYVLGDMEKFGPLLDDQLCKQLAVVYPQRQIYFRNKLRELAFDPALNPNSHPQIHKLIYTKWEIPPATDPRGIEIKDTQKETLELLMRTVDHPGLKALMNYREAKIERERLEAFLRSAAAHQGRVTTMWMLTGTRTGRLSSGGGTRPDKRNLGNLQNIPKRSLIEHSLVSSLEWRNWYNIAKKDITEANKQFQNLDWFAVCDFSQMELRVLALTCGETEMLDLFRAGADIHSAIGSLWSGWSVEELLEEGPKRTLVKIFHFGIIYGKTAKGLYQEMRTQGVNTSITQCELHLKRYFNKFKRVAQYKEDQANFAEKHGYVENLFGFKVPIDISGKSEGGFWRNQAINFPIQGCAHQVMLIALALLHRYPEKYSLLRPQMEIHDALVNVTPFKDIGNTVLAMQQLLEKDTLDVIKNELKVNWTVPLKADAKIGLTYGGLVKYNGDVATSAKGIVDKIKQSDDKLHKLQKEYKDIKLEEL